MKSANDIFPVKKKKKENKGDRKYTKSNKNIGRNKNKKSI